MKKLKIMAMVPALIALSCVLIVPNALAGKCKELESAMMYSEAAKCYHDATVANPMKPENHYLLGLVYLKQGNEPVEKRVWRHPSAACGVFPRF